MHTLYIDGPENGGEGIYHLMADTGEPLAHHYCSNASFARFDLVDRRKAQQQEWRERFGEYRVLRVGEDDMTRDELFRLHREWATAQAEPADA